MKTILRVLLAHGLSLALFWQLWPWLAQWLPMTPPIWAWLLSQGAVAALLGSWLGLARWWFPLNLLLPLLVLALLSLALPPWLYLVAFVLLLLGQWNSAGERVPLYLSNPTTWQALAGLLEQEGEGEFVDLGCGMGGLLFYLARQHPQGRFTGIESAPLPFAWAWLRWRLGHYPNLTLRYGNLWRTDWGAYTVLYAFLSPAPMAKLHTKFQNECRAGSLLISNSFAVPGQVPDGQHVLTDRRQTQLLLYRAQGRGSR